jgi:hypothetical protein
MKLKTILISSLIVFGHEAYGANCNYNTGLSNFTATLIDTPQVLAHQYTIQRNGDNAECANYHVYFTKGQANSYQRKAFNNGQGLPYNLHRTINTGTVLKDYGDALAGEFISATASNSNAQYSGNFYISLPNLDSTFSFPAGVYNDTFPIRFYSVGTSGTPEFQKDSWMTISITVPRYAHISLVPENNPHNPSSTTYIMDFQGMETNKEMGADLRVVSNVGYGVNVNSLNTGRLIRGSQSVPYTINLGDGQWRSFETGGNNWPMIQSQTGTAYEGRRYNIRVRLGNVPADLEGGDYQDTIVFTVQAW